MADSGFIIKFWPKLTNPFPGIWPSIFVFVFASKSLTAKLAKVFWLLEFGDLIVGSVILVLLSLARSTQSTLTSL
ncbi:hypothetical protein MFC_01452 [Mesomycoplasma flocculare ATCC 27716]|nr:hypothetical protein MFC_01452 [Mesomycoplasma flocculare ATCC 27716]